MLVVILYGDAGELESCELAWKPGILQHKFLRSPNFRYRFPYYIFFLKNCRIPKYSCSMPSGWSAFVVTSGAVRYSGAPIITFHQDTSYY